MNRRQQALIDAFQETKQAQQAALSPQTYETLMPLLREILTQGQAHEQSRVRLQRELNRLEQSGTEDDEAVIARLEDVLGVGRRRRQFDPTEPLFYHAEALLDAMEAVQGTPPDGRRL